MLQALAIICLALDYHSQMGRSSFHELMIISAAFGGYIVILAGILTGIFTGQPINKRIVRMLHTTVTQMSFHTSQVQNVVW
jgi:hypothetical protein